MAESEEEPSWEEVEAKFIENFCTPQEWKGSAMGYHILVMLISYLNEAKIAQHLRSLSYSDFLLTTYWKMISEEVKHRANYKCECCHGSKNLQTHHHDYSIHGEEHTPKNMTTLHCLCGDCHSGIHQIMKKRGRKP
jgi:hypothetical protein